jgi:hypothetical protein
MKSQKVGLTAIFFAFSLPMIALGQNGGFLKEYDNAKSAKQSTEPKTAYCAR